MAAGYFLGRIDSSIIPFGIVFILLFTLVFYGASRIFRDKYGNVSKGTAGVIAFCISLLAVWGIYRSNWDISSFFYGLGISETALWVIGIIAFVIIAFLMIKALKFCGFMMVLGAGLMLIGILTDWVYQKAVIIIVGVALLLLGLWLCVKKKKKLPYYDKVGPSNNYSNYARKLRAKQKYNYYKALKEHEKAQRRNLEREKRRQEIRDKKLRARLQAEKDLRRRKENQRWAQEQIRENQKRISKNF